MRFENSTVIVTGGTGQIGWAIASRFADAGARVIITYLSNREQAAVYSQYLRPSDVTPLPGQVIFPFQLDIGLPESIDNFASWFKREFGQVDVLVNNAGVNYPAAFNEISQPYWDEIMAVNLRGPWLLTKALQHSFSSSGNIINIGSVSGFIGGPVSSHYASSKAGLVGLTQNMAKYFAPDVRVNMVAPGYISSPMAAGATENELVQEVVRQIPLSRLGNAREVANVVLFIASQYASYMTGTTIHVNGGLYG